MTILNNLLLLITRSHLSIAQASSSFNRLNTCSPTHATPTFITEVLCLVTQVRTVAFNECFSGLMPYTALANS